MSIDHTNLSSANTIRGATVEFCGAHKRYGGITAVEEFNLKIASGEFLTLLGPSGSGKTTLLNMLAGFIEPSGGDIMIDGIPVTRIPTEMRNIGMVFQNYSLFPHMTVGQNIAFPLKMRKIDSRQIKTKVSDALALVGLPEYVDRMPSQLSGGQRQRIAFARAIVFEPKVLLMDEPLGALDLKLRERMQLEIRRYHEQIGCTIIYVTHDQGEALTLSDNIVIMNEGQAIQRGSPLEIYDKPNSKFAAEFVGETNILKVSTPSESGKLMMDELDLPFPLAVSDRLTLNISIRPEKIIRILPNDDHQGEGWVEFDATVQEFIFYGDQNRGLVTCESGKQIVFREHRATGNSTVLHPGERIRLAFPAEEAILLYE